MTRPLLSDAGLRRLAADVFGQGPEGTDVVSAESLDPEPLPGVAGWEGAPLSATVDCGDCGHRVAFGKCCPQCHHGCSMPGDPECPGND